MKKILATLLLGLALIVAALPAAAETSGSAVTMTATAQGASVKLELPAESVQGVKAMRLSFAVESTDPVEADFAFDSALPGSVQQYRYDDATGRLNIYVAGGQELFPEGTASLGSIRVEAPAGSTATVRLVEDSLELVNGAFGRTAAPAVAPASVEVTAAEESPAPVPTPESTQPPAEQPGQESTTGQQSGTAQNTQSASDPASTATVIPEATAVPAGNGQTTVTSGGSGTAQKPAKGSGGSSAAPQVTPNPTEAPQSSPAPAASAEPSATPATPEQAETAAAPAMNLPLAVIIAVACLAVAVLIGIAVLRFRSR